MVQEGATVWAQGWRLARPLSDSMALRGLGPLPNTARELGFGQDGYLPASWSLKAMGRQASGRGAWLGPSSSHT